MRKPMVAGNWKMNGSRSDVISLVEGIKQGVPKKSPVSVVVLPSFIHIPQIEPILVGSEISWGAQNLYLGASGAFTGEISGSMLAEYGCKYVLVGHSERRHLFKEDLKLVAAKFKAAVEFGLQPILCVGETLAQREEGQTEKVIAEQLQSVIEIAGIEAFNRTIVAYEPVWAIGTGLTATPAQAESVHAYIRELIAEQSMAIAGKLSILYGGSVKADNAKGLFAQPNIDGGLIGGASLDVKGFLEIIKGAECRCRVD